MHKFLKPWILVIIGILFNIASAIITHYFIGVNNQKLNDIEMKAAQYDTLIDSQWRTKTEIERSQQFQLTLLTQPNSQHTQEIQQVISRQLQLTIDQQALEGFNLQTAKPIDFDTIQHISHAASQKIITSINDTYLEKLDLQQQIPPLQEKNSLLFTMSIFLQLTGLILVLAKDIAR